MAMPITSRLIKFGIDSFYQTTKNSVLRSKQINSLFINRQKNYGTVTEEKKNDADADTADTADTAATDAETVVPEAEKKLKTEIEELSKEISILKEKNIVIHDKYQRALAEGQNTRVRLTDAIENAKIYAIQGFCKDLLDVADILGRATESVPKDELTEKNPHLQSLYKGLTLTESELHKAFKKHGLLPINPLDEKFNPDEHESLFKQKVEGKETGTVVVVSKIGYKLHQRIIRPAQVVIAI